MNWTNRRLVVAVGVACVVAARLAAQQPVSSSLAGKASDASGAHMPGVTITVSSGDVRRAISTDDTGRYRIDGLLPGPYRLEAALPGFVTETLEPVSLQPGQESTWNPVVRLPGGMGESVSVHVERITGVAAVDCGRHKTWAEKRVLEDALRCARAAVRRGAAFWVMQDQFSTDSTIINGLLARPGGPIQYFSYDSAPVGGPAEQSNFAVAPCRAPKVRSERLPVDGKTYILSSFEC